MKYLYEMQGVFDFLFAQYAEYSFLHIWLEVIAVILGVASVAYSYLNKIWVYPTGLVSTGIFVYLLFSWGLLGDMIVNAYYFLMSIYGWYVWSRKVDGSKTTPITTIRKQEFLQLVMIMIGSAMFVAAIYVYFNKLSVETNKWISYVDIFTTAVAFAGMWLMAKRKLEHWYFWLVVNIVSVPLYFIKGYTFTSIQYFFLLVLAIMGIIEWNKQYNQEKVQ